MADSPDMWMEAEVGKMVMRCRERVERLSRINKLIEKEPDPERQNTMRDALLMNEIRLCRNIGVAIKARAKEVAEHMTKALLLDNVTEDLIRENPWLICCAAGYQFDRICMLLDARDAANGEEGC